MLPTPDIHYLIGFMHPPLAYKGIHLYINTTAVLFHAEFWDVWNEVCLVHVFVIIQLIVLTQVLTINQTRFLRNVKIICPMFATPLAVAVFCELHSWQMIILSDKVKIQHGLSNDICDKIGPALWRIDDVTSVFWWNCVDCEAVTFYCYGIWHLRCLHSVICRITRNILCCRCYFDAVCSRIPAPGEPAVYSAQLAACHVCARLTWLLIFGCCRFLLLWIHYVL